jgi:hypothetical protein
MSNFPSIYHLINNQQIHFWTHKQAMNYNVLLEARNLFAEWGHTAVAPTRQCSKLTLNVENVGVGRYSWHLFVSLPWDYSLQLHQRQKRLNSFSGKAITSQGWNCFYIYLMQELTSRIDVQNMTSRIWMQEPVLPGCFLRAKAIGLMPMIDQVHINKSRAICLFCISD